VLNIVHKKKKSNKFPLQCCWRLLLLLPYHVNGVYVVVVLPACVAGFITFARIPAVVGVLTLLAVLLLLSFQLLLAFLLLWAVMSLLSSSVLLVVVVTAAACVTVKAC
jgi:hypothetical protein